MTRTGSIVKDYPRSAAQRGREMFMPLAHPAAEAQAEVCSPAAAANHG